MREEEEARVTSVTRPRDEIDWRIVNALAEDGRTTNKDIAQRLNISEANVAARIRWLRKNKVMLVTVQRDIYSQGFEFQCAVEVSVKGRQAKTVARDLAKFEDVNTVSLLVGRPEIVLVCNARDRQHLHELLYRDIAGTRGVDRIATQTALKIHKYKSSYADLVSE